eukprot:gene29510-21392_t
MAGTGPSTPPAGGSSSSSSSGGGRKGGGKRREDEVAPSSSQKRQKKAKPNSQRPRWEGSAGLFDLPGDEDPMAMPHPPSNSQSITDSLVKGDLDSNVKTSYYHSHKTSDTVRASGMERKPPTTHKFDDAKPDMADMDHLTPELTELVSSLQAER